MSFKKKIHPEIAITYWLDASFDSHSINQPHFLLAHFRGNAPQLTAFLKVHINCDYLIRTLLPNCLVAASSLEAMFTLGLK